MSSQNRNQPSLLRETLESLRLGCEFIDAEITYLNDLPRIGNDVYLAELYERAELLRKFAEDVQHHRIGLEVQGEEQLNPSDVARTEILLGKVAGVLQDISGGLIQRRTPIMNLHGGGHPSSYATRRRMRNVHPDYSVTQHAITAAARYYTHQLGSFFDFLKSPILCPMVSVSRGRFYSIQLFNPIIGNVQSSQNRDDSIRRLLGFSRIYPPRYFPTQIRYSALLSHELVHLALRAHEILLYEVEARHVGVQRIVSEGPALRTLQPLGAPHRILFQTIGRFRIRLEETYKEMIQKEPGERAFRSWRDMSDVHSKELVADLLAFVNAGPAYVYAFVSKVLMTSPASEMSGEDTHPPSWGRAALLSLYLGACDFHSTKMALDDDISDLAQKLNPMTRARTVHLSAVFRNHFEDIADDLVSAGESMIGTRITEGGRRLPYMEEMTEADWTDRCRHILNSIHSGDVFFRNRAEAATSSPQNHRPYDPGDLVNAMWSKRFHPELRSEFGDVRKRYQWRYAMAANFGEARYS